MPIKNVLDTHIEQAEWNLAKFKFIKKNFPDAHVSIINNRIKFSDKSINQLYTNVKFYTKFNTLKVEPYYELDFEHNGRHEIIIINSRPKYSRLAYYMYGKNLIKFSRLNINLKNNNFKPDMISKCRLEIIKFIKSKPNYSLDLKNLEPKLKKLISFI